MSGHGTEVAFRKMWQWGSPRIPQLSPFSIISPMSYTNHYFNTIRFRKRGRRRLRKLQKSAPSCFISVFNQIDAQNLFHNKFHFLPLHVSSTCAHHQRLCNTILTS